MKRIDGIILTIVLLLTAMGVCANDYKGTLKNDGHTMEWSVSGITVTKKGQPRLESTVMTSAGEGNLKQEIEGTVARGATINASLKKVSGKNKPKVYIDFDYYRKGSGFPVNYGRQIQLEEKESTSRSFTVPSDADEVIINIIYRTPDPRPRSYALEMSVVFRLKVGKPAAAPAPAPVGTGCHACGELHDSHIRFNDFCGQVMYRCSKVDDDCYEMADFDAILYEKDMIYTYDEESMAILGLEDNSTYVVKPLTKIIIDTDRTKVSKFKMLVGSMWANIKKMAEGKSLEFEMNQASLAINGTIFACEEKNGVSSVYLFAGKVTVKSKKTNKKQVLQPGQTTSVGKDGKIVVKKFNIEQGAKKFGIPMSEIRNHYSTTTTTTTTRRYEVERAIVKYKVTKGSQQGTMAKVFDNHGQLERRELKMGNQTTLQLTQGNTSYNLDKNTKTYQQVTNAELNFLNMNASVMQKLKLQKKGTAKVLDKDCTIYANSDTEYYVWKGIVLKKVQRSSNGTTTTEATSVELPASVDSKYFKMPEGYRRKN